MDTYKSKKLEKELKGKMIGGYEVVELQDFGKSAAVFKAKGTDNNLYAIKIFDNDLVESLGHEIQEKRIEQEIELKNYSIPNLVKIIEGGKSLTITEEDYYYLVMEFREGFNLKQFISTSDYDNTFIRKVVGTLFTVSEALLNLGIVHRDIKPENIMIDNSNEITLMDLGVLKLIGKPSFSDQDEKRFVGTLRYAPPEFLTRNEEDSIDGWRAVNFYQIGGVLHDLIMKKELFKEITPYSNLVLVIKEDAPKILNPEFPYETIHLTLDLLTKDWKKRLDLCPIKRIESFIVNDPNNFSSVEKEIENILAMTSEHKFKFDEIEKIERSNKEKATKRFEISKQLENVIDDCIETIYKKGLFLKKSKSSLFAFDTDIKEHKSFEVRNYLYKIEGKLEMGFSRPMYLLVRWKNDESSYAQIYLMVMFLNPIFKVNFANPKDIFQQILREQFKKTKQQTSQTPILNLPTNEVFKGTLGFDNQFKDKITLEILKIIRTGIKSISNEVRTELTNREKVVKGESSISEMQIVATIMIGKSE